MKALTYCQAPDSGGAVGFSSWLGKSGAYLLICRIAEWSWEYTYPVHLDFVDLEKAYSHVL